MASLKKTQTDKANTLDQSPIRTNAVRGNQALRTQAPDVNISAQPPENEAAIPIIAADTLGPLETRPLDSLRHYKPHWAWPPDFKTTWVWQVLRDDFIEHGMRDPLIILADGQVIDGGHRLDLARELGFDPVPVRVAALPLPLPLSNPDCLGVETFAVQSATDRRQLTRHQITSLLFDLDHALGRTDPAAIKQANLRRGKSPGQPLRAGPAAEALARATGLSPRYIHQVQAIAHHETRALRDRVKRGELTVGAAYKALKRGPDTLAEWQSRILELTNQAHALIERAFDLSRECGSWPAAHHEAFLDVLHRAAEGVEARRLPIETRLEDRANAAS